MKLLLLILAFFILCLPLQAQKKRDILINRVISVTESTEDVEDGQKPLKTEYIKYDPTGEVIEEIKYKNNGDFDFHTSYEYDSKGNKKRETWYNSKRQKEYTVDIEYDNDGNKVKEIYTNAKGNKEKTIEYKYSNGLKTEKIIYLANGKIKMKKKYNYEFQK